MRRGPLAQLARGCPSRPLGCKPEPIHQYLVSIFRSGSFARPPSRADSPARARLARALIDKLLAELAPPTLSQPSSRPHPCAGQRYLSAQTGSRMPLQFMPVRLATCLRQISAIWQEQPASLTAKSSNNKRSAGWLAGRASVCVAPNLRVGAHLSVGASNWKQWHCCHCYRRLHRFRKHWAPFKTHTHSSWPNSALIVHRDCPHLEAALASLCFMAPTNALAGHASRGQTLAQW